MKTKKFQNLLYILAFQFQMEIDYILEEETSGVECEDFEDMWVYRMRPLSMPVDNNGFIPVLLTDELPPMSFSNIE